LTAIKENKSYVTTQYLKKAAQNAKHIKTRSYELMQIQADSQVLDVGCGPAIDTIPLSEFIGKGGCIVGIDNDAGMVEKANQEIKKLKSTKHIEHIEGNAESLPFAEGEFDRVHAERLFQVLPEENTLRVFGELNRVLKGNGRIVLVDTDWGSVSVNYSDSALERRLVTFFASKLRPNGFAGRQLFGLLKEHGYSEVKVEVVPVVHRNFLETPFSEWVPTEALKSKVATREELDRWVAELTEKTARETYFSYVNMVIVAGTKR
jgi:ubiquinone/menaquinone biosynthesis C-methylase UbiE